MERREEEAGDEIDECSARPDFGILCYAVISMHDGVTHDRTREVLFGNGDGTALTAALSCEDCIPSDCPPVFLWHSEDDALSLIHISMPSSSCRSSGFSVSKTSP